MDVAVFSSKSYDRYYLDRANQAAGSPHQFRYFENRLRAESAPVAKGLEAVCAFVHDQLDRACLEILAEQEVRYVVLRCAGYNQVDLQAAKERGIQVARVPAYSPHAVAEHAFALLLTLNRKTHRAYNRVREANFSLEGLIGFDLKGKTVGVIGTGKIGAAFCEIAMGFGCQVLAYDVHHDEDLQRRGVEYRDQDDVFREADIVSLHVPLLEATRHLVNADTLQRMKDGVTIVNTSRGGLVDTADVIEAVKQGKVGGLALDVYEEEAAYFYEDMSGRIIQDDQLMRLMTFPNVLITSHQGFFTDEALSSIARTTVENLSAFASDGTSPNEVTIDG